MSIYKQILLPQALFESRTPLLLLLVVYGENMSQQHESMPFCEREYIQRMAFHQFGGYRLLGHFTGLFYTGSVRPFTVVVEIITALDYCNL